MNTKQLTYCIRNDQKLSRLCLGVFPVDRLPAPEAYPFCVVQNLDTSKQPGSHWTATYVDHDGYGAYFDSYGRCPPKRIETYLKRHCDDAAGGWAHNDQAVQSVYSSACGQHCLYFLWSKANYPELGFDQIISTYQDAAANDDNDRFVTDFVNDNFDLNTVSVDHDYVWEQICKSLDGG